MRRAATVRRRLLICQNLGVHPPAPPLPTCLKDMGSCPTRTKNCERTLIFNSNDTYFKIITKFIKHVINRFLIKWDNLEVGKAHFPLYNRKQSCWAFEQLLTQIVLYICSSFKPDNLHNGGTKLRLEGTFRLRYRDHPYIMSAYF